MIDPTLSIRHRPWPLPKKPWVLSQQWRDLAFIHYRVDAAELRRLLPAELTVQELDGSAWVGVVPFRMEDVAPRGLPALPGISTFPELNVRTYVEAEGKAGVWFFSLDALSRMAVFGGRFLYGLPYFKAEMSQKEENGWIHLQSRRTKGKAAFSGRYRGVGEPFLAEAGTFAHWATERYCLYSRHRDGRLIRLDVHHLPWPLQNGEARITASDILAAAEIHASDELPRVHFSRGVEVISYGPEFLA